MRLLFLAAAAAATLAGGAAATLAISDNSLALAGSTTSAAPAVAPARTTEDVSGPCDEAENANDARCAAATTTTATEAAGLAERSTVGDPQADRVDADHHGVRHGDVQVDGAIKRVRVCTQCIKSNKVKKAS